jgi:hypothetical protein
MRNLSLSIADFFSGVSIHSSICSPGIANVRDAEIVLPGEMALRNLVIAVVALGTLLAAGQPGTWQHLTTSARNFEQRFEELKGAGNALSPLERIVFSLALAGTKSQ